MTYKTHLMGGVLSAVVVTKFAMNPDLELLPFFIGGTLFGSLFPDIDHTSSYIGRRLKPASLIVNTLVGHRGATHSLLINIPFIAALSVLSIRFQHIVALDISKMFILGLFIGILSHLLLDSFTKSGVPLFYPFLDKKISILPIRTGGFFEFIYVGLLAFLTFSIWSL